MKFLNGKRFLRIVLLSAFAIRSSALAGQTGQKIFNQIEGALVRNCRAAPGTGEFFRFSGRRTSDIVLNGNDFRQARSAVGLDKEVASDAVRELNNILK